MKTYCSALVSLLLSAALPALIHAEDRVPTGFKLERYTRLWERNPFIQVKPPAPESNPSPFEKLVLTSWLKDNGKFAIFVQSSDTDKAQRITAEPNQDSLRLIAMHLDPNPALVEAVISSPTQRGVVKFRFGQLSTEQVSPETGQTGNIGSTGSKPTVAPSQSAVRSPGSFGNAQNTRVPAPPTPEQTVSHSAHPAIQSVYGEDGPAPQQRVHLSR